MAAQNKCDSRNTKGKPRGALNKRKKKCGVSRAQTRGAGYWRARAHRPAVKGKPRGAPNKRKKECGVSRAQKTRGAGYWRARAHRPAVREIATANSAEEQGGETSKAERQRGKLFQQVTRESARGERIKRRICAIQEDRASERLVFQASAHTSK